MRYKTNKLRELEASRYSVFTNELHKCFFCNSTQVELHELMSGRNRQNSMKLGYVLPVCRKHHKAIQYNLDYKKLCQRHYEMSHTRSEWLSIFYKNYL